MIHLKRTYYLHLHLRFSPDDMRMIILSIVYENLSLRELDNSMKLDLDELRSRGFLITMADVEVENEKHEHLPNTQFMSLMYMSAPVTSGVFTPNCPTGYTDCESCGYWHGEISECEYDGTLEE